MYVIFFVDLGPEGRLELAARPEGGYCIAWDGTPLDGRVWPDEQIAEALATFRAMSRDLRSPPGAATAAA